MTNPQSSRPPAQAYYIVSKSELNELQQAAIRSTTKGLSAEERTRLFNERAAAEAACLARPIHDWTTTIAIHPYEAGMSFQFYGVKP